MALNPYTLNHLYEKGILDYVPADLMMPAPIGTIMPMSNPYLDMAKQGGLYQNSINVNDTFQMTSGINTQSHPLANPNGAVIGSKSNAGGMNTFNGYNVGVNSKYTTAHAFGEDGITGALSNAGGMNTFNGYNVGTNTNVNTNNIFGGLPDVTDGVSNGVNKAATAISSLPKTVLGLAAVAIALIGIKSAFKHTRKPANKGIISNHSWSKFNPISWFRKKN